MLFYSRTKGKEVENMEKVLTVTFSNNSHIDYYYDDESIIADNGNAYYKLKGDSRNTGIYTILCDIERMVMSESVIESLKVYNEYTECFMEEIEYFLIIRKAIKK